MPIYIIIYIPLQKRKQSQPTFPRPEESRRSLEAMACCKSTAFSMHLVACPTRTNKAMAKLAASRIWLMAS